MIFKFFIQWLSPSMEVIKKNANTLSIALTLFLANQILEFLIMTLLNYSYNDLCGWDCGWYSGILHNGYDLEPHGHAKGDAANWAFFPALPLIGRLISNITGYSPQLSLIITGKIFFLLSIVAFIKLGYEYYPKINPLILGGVAAFNPYSIYGNVGYTEPLFLFFSCLFFYFLKRKNFIIAGLMGSILTSVRFVGVVAVAAYLSKIITPSITTQHTKFNQKMLLGLLLIPIGISLFMILLYHLTGDALAFSHVQIAWRRIPHNPFDVILVGLKNDPLQQYWSIMSCIALVVPLYFVYKRNFELAIFSIFCTLIPLSTSLQAMPRYIWWQVPILLVTAIALSKKLTWVVLFPASIMGLTYIYCSWFMGKGFVT